MADNNEATKKIINLDWKNATIDDINNLLDKGADINAKNEQGYSVLMNVLRYNRTDLACFVIDKGAKVNETGGNRGWTPLMLACQNGDMYTAEKLLNKGANPNVRSDDEYGYTPLIIASAGGYTNIALMLVDRGAIIDTSSKNGYGAISIAASNGHMDTAMALSARKMPMYGMYRIKHKDPIVKEDSSFIRV